jgi:hypothetical protein
VSTHSSRPSMWSALRYRHSVMTYRNRGSDIREQDLQSQERLEDDLARHLDREQFVAETSRAVPRLVLSRRAAAALWGLRVFVVVVSLMVIYTFIDQLH